MFETTYFRNHKDYIVSSCEPSCVTSIYESIRASVDRSWIELCLASSIATRRQIDDIPHATREHGDTFYNAINYIHQQVRWIIMLASQATLLAS